jgi:hypothetical protein
MKNKLNGYHPLIIGAVALICTSAGGQAANFTAAATGNWSLGATWGNNGNNVVGSGVPGASDTIIIATGKTVTYDNSAPSTVGSVEVLGSIVISKSGGTFGDFTIDGGGAFSFGGQVPVTFSGNFTNNGIMNISGQSQTANTIYSGTGKTIAGNVTNQVVNITGSYTNVGTLVTGANAQGAVNLLGSGGSLVNLGTLLYNCNAAPTITTLDCSAPGNTFRWAGINMSSTTPKAAAYYNLIIGNTGTAGFPLSGAGLGIGGNLTVTNTGPITSWPANNSIGGVLIYSTSSGNVSTFPSAFSVGGFNQTAGKVAIPANGVLTVTGTGAGTWTRSGGSLSQTASSTVKFTGSAPDIGGPVANSFANLIIDGTATNASASANFSVTNGLTIVAGASLDLSALGGSAHTMSSAESLFGSGTIIGSVVTVSGSKVYAGPDGTYGTNHISTNLTMAAGSTINLDVNSSANAANDILAVDGTLALANTVFKLKAPGVGAAIDTGNDYTLVTAGAISGTPVLNWVTAPIDSTNYSLITTTTAIKLHYGGVVTTGSPTLTFTRSGNQLTVSWDSVTFPGFTLRSQSNSAGVVSGGTWSDVPGGNASPVMVTMDQADPTFFRLFKP